jgi:hypothetical protein
VGINTWWANDPAEIYWMEITDRSDIGGELWAPKLNAVGREEWSYTLVSHVQPGDRIFHWRKESRAIVGWSQASGPLSSDVRSWQARGTAGRTRGVPSANPTWVMPLEGLHTLTHPVTREDLNGTLYHDVLKVLGAVEDAAGTPAYAPFQHYGGRELRAQQGYLTKVPAALVSLLFPSDEEVRSVALPDSTGPKRGRGQAYITDAVRRSAIERHAVDEAKNHYLGLGATDIVELGKPYDLQLTLGGIERHIEVKGSTVPDVETVLVTQGEVAHANRWATTDLVVVDGILLRYTEDGDITTSGGRLRTWSNWVPADRHLLPTQLRYTIPS